MSRWLFVTVRNLAGEELATVDFPSSTTIDKVKASFAEQSNLPPSRLRLVDGITLLIDDNTLNDLAYPTELTLIRLQWKASEGTFRQYDLVQLHYDGNVVYDALRDAGFPWSENINNMLGRTFVVQSVPQLGCVALPSPDVSSANPHVVFPESLVREGEVLEIGDIVRLTDDEDIVMLAFRTDSFIRKEGLGELHVAFRWGGSFRHMLGGVFPIVEMPCRSLVALPWQDDNQQVVLYFPVSLVSKVQAEHESVIRRERQ